eukprot:CAMPEP_0205826916 /NCGR_PEP_ID=MMETSP0206-20130828/30241_1 /ASSEMBLY_ACC=CAM_ASM_000279 /TAXON_ID=36767 /ORGANISM="Euplotes focardii, Strain TN1" /LENGTH=311 /DNA_ID=CAMNT_0053127263 /DNA_START=24 /DNA_END=959 /DNA_ORIENTATION=-
MASKSPSFKPASPPLGRKGSFALAGDDERQLLFGLPKKGRLYEKCLALLEGAGIRYTRRHRLDIALCRTLPITLVFLPASDIAQYVGEGNVDMGITGLDIIKEQGVRVDTLMELGFGKCRLCVQGPVGQYQGAKELCGKRIVTSFPNLAKKYFEELEPETKTSVRYVSGSVEAACSLGLADAVVDLVETGTTMRAAGLEIVSKVMDTETLLIGNPNSEHKELMELVKRRIEGHLVAQRSRLMKYNIERKNLHKAILITPGHESPTITSLDDADWVSVSALVKAKEQNEIMDELEAVGAKSILILAVANARF